MNDQNVGKPETPEIHVLWDSMSEKFLVRVESGMFDRLRAAEYDVLGTLTRDNAETFYVVSRSDLTPSRAHRFKSLTPRKPPRVDWTKTTM